MFEKTFIHHIQMAIRVVQAIHHSPHVASGEWVGQH